jgi:dihydrofolate synthase/folylpolyglutamate synthase
MDGPVDYREAIDYLLSFTDLERGVQKSANPAMSVASVKSLLSRLNNPQDGRITVHVTGSKGKGTTASMIAGILRRAGLRTSLFTSPHLHAYTERININGEAVSAAEFAAALGAIRAHVEDERESVHGEVSTFGILTALFFWLTRAQVPRIDAQVVEVGLGGSFDATNVFTSPDLAVITPISLEHTAILGSTTVEIARDKAGIIKPGATCVLAPQKDPAVVDVVRARCEEVGAELVDVGLQYEVEPGEHFIYGQAFTVRGPDATYGMRTPMLGHHQLDNAATAVAAAEALNRRGLSIGALDIADGVAMTRVAGRMEVMGQKPLIVGDGAHNAESAAALARTLKEYFTWRRCFIVLGALRDKDVRGMGFKLARLAEMIVCTRIDNPRSMDPYEMIQEVGFLGPMAVAEESVPAALETALAHANEDDLVCITGSLYLVARAREHLLGESVQPL